MVFVFLYLPSLSVRISGSNRLRQMPLFHTFFCLILHTVCVSLVMLGFGGSILGCMPLHPLCSLQRLQGMVLPASSSIWGRQVALGWWPPPSCVCLHLPVASLCVSSCVSWEDPVLGGRAPLIQEVLLPDPARGFSMCLLCYRDTR